MSDTKLHPDQRGRELMRSLLATAAGMPFVLKYLEARAPHDHEASVLLAVLARLNHRAVQAINAMADSSGPIEVSRWLKDVVQEGDLDFDGSPPK